MNLHAIARRGRRAERLLRAKVWGHLHPGIAVGHNVQIGRRCRLFLDPGARLVFGERCEIDDGTTLAVYGTGVLLFGDGSFVGHTCTLAAHERVEVGPGAYLGELVSVRDHDHEVGEAPASGRTAMEPVTIGTGVWIGGKATVLRGATIGEGAVVGANAVVRGEIDPWTVNVGVPARAVRSLRPDDS